MTTEEFDATKWGANMKARYHSDDMVYMIASCDFEEKLVGLLGIVSNAPNEVSWVRCEHVDLMNRQVRI